MCNDVKSEGTMKKTYILPEIQIVHLTPGSSVLVLSADLTNEVIDDPDDFGTKEDSWSDVWDD